jgi:hypothetical protein
VSNRGLSDEQRQLGLAAKRAKRDLAIGRIRKAAEELRLEAAGSDRQPTHSEIFKRAAVTRTTYFRYMQVDNEIRSLTKLQASPGSASEEIAGSAAGALGPSGQRDPLLAKLLLENEGLKRQVAVCKTLIHCFEIDSAAAKNQLATKDGLLKASRGKTEELRAKLVAMQNGVPTPSCGASAVSMEAALQERDSVTISGNVQQTTPADRKGHLKLVDKTAAKPGDS